MDVTGYKAALAQAKQDLTKATERLAKVQERLANVQGDAADAERDVMELRQTIAVLARLCGDPESIEKDALGLTDVIRMVFRVESGGKVPVGMSAHDVREKMLTMGYGGRWDNLLASVYTIIKRLHEQGQLEPAGNVKGKDTFVWNSGPRGIRAVTKAPRPRQRV